MRKHAAVADAGAIAEQMPAKGAGDRADYCAKSLISKDMVAL
jgi:hypothetical protein